MPARAAEVAMGNFRSKRPQEAPRGSKRLQEAPNAPKPGPETLLLICLYSSALNQKQAPGRLSAHHSVWFTVNLGCSCSPGIAERLPHRVAAASLLRGAQPCRPTQGGKGEGVALR